MKFHLPSKSVLSRVGVLYFALSTVLPLLIVIALHYSLRQAANDPQIQLAEDTAAALNSGRIPGELTATPVNMRSSLAPFIIVTDKNRQVKYATGQLDGRTVLPPAGVFTQSNGGQNRVTWQPAAGVRQATIVVPYQDGYVLAARNLREVEERKAQVATSSAAVVAALLVFGIIVLTVL